MRNASERRTTIPDKPKNVSLNFWSFMKQCIGKDLTSVSVPIGFNEPLSMLQRITEDLEYSMLLDKAASCSCPFEQLAYVAVFSISTYAHSTRVTKPFNPLLGETFEFDRREDLGWRVFCEQVGHRPPTLAQHCEGKDWIFSQDFYVETKFTGNDIEVTPHGEATIKFKKGNTFSWNRIITVVHNFIVGTLWVDQQGVVNLTGRNNTKGIVGHIKFIPSSSSAKKTPDYRKVEGEISDDDGNVKWMINGNWDRMVEITPVDNPNISRENLVMGEPIKAWTITAASPGSSAYYNFSIFACQLNEMEDGVAPTDSRLRPDQRLLEDGKFDEANKIKTQLEEKQRRRREELIRRISKMRISRDYLTHQPTWFNSTRKDDGTLSYEFKETYWSCKEIQDWSSCPDIFL